MNTIEKLDTLAEFYSQRDTLNIRKTELLAAVTVPADIEKMVADGWAESHRIEGATNAKAKAELDKLEAELQAVKIPDEIKEQLAAIDAVRSAIEFKKRAVINTYAAELAVMRSNVEHDIQAKTAQVFADHDKRKADIEIEFNGKAEDVDANIKSLEAEIKADVKAGGVSVKGAFFHAVYVKGRVTWNTDKMEAWMVDHPFLAAARKEGDPSITLRKI